MHDTNTFVHTVAGFHLHKLENYILALQMHLYRTFPCLCLDMYWLIFPPPVYTIESRPVPDSCGLSTAVLLCKHRELQNAIMGSVG